jgi:hypothetical protein
MGHEHPPVWEAIALLAGFAVVLYVIWGPA